MDSRTRHTLLLITLIYCLISIRAVSGRADGKAPEPENTSVSKSHLLDELDAWLSKSADISADFKQEYRHPLKDETTRAAGRIEIKKPSMVRIEYTEPDSRLMLMNSEEIISYQSELGQVLRGSAKDVVEPVFFSFLSRNVSLEKEYMTRLLASTGKTKNSDPVHVIELVPIKPSGAFARLLVSFHFSPVRILRLVAVEHSGALNSFTLSKVKINTGILKYRFRFERPPGVRQVPVTPMSDGQGLFLRFRDRTINI